MERHCTIRGTVALGFKIRGRGWPLKQLELKKVECQNANFEGHYLLRNSPAFKKKGSWITPKSCQKSKIGGHFYKMCTCDPMSPSSATPVYNHQPTIDSSCLNAPTFGPNHCSEPAILRSEIVAAVKKLKAGKAPGNDEIPGELLKYGGDCIIDQLHHRPHLQWYMDEGNHSRWLDKIHYSHHA